MDSIQVYLCLKWLSQKTGSGAYQEVGISPKFCGVPRAIKIKKVQEESRCSDTVQCCRSEETRVGIALPRLGFAHKNCTMHQTSAIARLSIRTFSRRSSDGHGDIRATQSSHAAPAPKHHTLRMRVRNELRSGLLSIIHCRNHLLHFIVWPTQ